MELAEQLRTLEAAKGDAALLALAAVDLAHHALPAERRARVKDALLAASVPHWCDPAFLADLLPTTLEEAHELLELLGTLTVVEPFPARGARAVNVRRGDPPHAARAPSHDEDRPLEAAVRRCASPRCSRAPNLAHASRPSITCLQSNSPPRPSNATSWEGHCRWGAPQTSITLSAWLCWN